MEQLVRVHPAFDPAFGVPGDAQTDVGGHEDVVVCRRTLGPFEPHETQVVVDRVHVASVRSQLVVNVVS